jgi:hypothetical protein
MKSQQLSFLNVRQKEEILTIISDIDKQINEHKSALDRLHGSKVILLQLLDAKYKDNAFKQ